MFSTIGLEASADKNGIGNLWLHYNRATRIICEKLFDFPFALNKKDSDICGLQFGNGSARLAFFERDAFVFEAEGIEEIPMFCGSQTEYWIEQKNEKEIIIKGYSKNTDGRDPDEKVGFSANVKAEK